MTKAFNKGDLVTYISGWDRKGTVYVRDAIVHSCGKKQMVLTDAATGAEMGRHFMPVRAQIGEGGTFPRMTADEAHAAATAYAEAFLAAETKRLKHCRDVTGAYQPESYRNAIQKLIDEMHEPRVEIHKDLCDRVVAHYAAINA